MADAMRITDKFRRDGTPYESTELEQLFAWAKDMEGDRTVDQTYFSDGGWLSTVWLGLDHGYGWMFADPLTYKPIIFETMFFPGLRKGEQLQQRYATEAEAQEGHRIMVQDLVADGWKVSNSARAQRLRRKLAMRDRRLLRWRPMFGLPDRRKTLHAVSRNPRRWRVTV